jgi:dTDP-4-amino-4,6-dideoxygalactose transaminase
MMSVNYIGLKEQHKELKDKIQDALLRVLEHSQFILGEEVEEFEENFARYCNVRYAVGVNSGTDALFLALKVLGIGKGDEVITVPNSFISTTSSIIAAGATPVFVDTGDDLNIDPSLIEEKISTKTRAILPVHLTGKPAQMDKVLKIAEKYGLYVIEDAAQAIGAEYKGRRVGSFGVLGCFSLHPLKTLNACGDGGVIVTDDEVIYRKLLCLRNIGLKNRDEAILWGYNSRLDALQASILNVKLEYLDEWIGKRRRNAHFYIKNLRDYVKTPFEHEYEKATYHTFIIQAKERDQLKDYLLSEGVEVKIHYPIPIHLQRAAKHLGYKEGDFPKAEAQAKEILSLPIHQYLTREQIEYVVFKIKDFYRKNRVFHETEATNAGR